MAYVLIGFELAIGVALACLAVWLVWLLMAAMLEKIAVIRAAEATRDDQRRRAALRRQELSSR